MKAIFFIILSVAFSVNAASLSRQIHCMESNASIGKKIRLTYATISYDTDNWMISYVKYSNSDKPIPLNLVESSHENDGTKSELITEKWSEFIKGKVNGYYVISTQGVYVNNFTYTNKNGVDYIFKENANAFSPDSQSCDWNRID